MRLHNWLTTGQIKAVFKEEISAAGGTISDTFDDDTRLFARSILPHVREVRNNDQVQGGVALRATEEKIWVHPYLFRQVCRNGAIMAQALQTPLVERSEFEIGEEAAREMGAAVQAC